VACPCEHGNESAGSIKVREFFDKLSRPLLHRVNSLVSFIWVRNLVSRIMGKTYSVSEHGAEGNILPCEGRRREKPNEKIDNS
jgi:hypothetical protein